MNLHQNNQILGDEMVIQYFSHKEYLVFIKEILDVLKP